MTDTRCHPLIELDRARIREMLLPVLNGAEQWEVAPVEGGLANTIYRIRIEGERRAYALRVYAAGQAAFERERRLLYALNTKLPVPELLFADASGLRCAYPYLVYRWIEGVTLNDCRRQMPPEALPELAKPLGVLLAKLARVPLEEILDEEVRASLPALKVESMLAINDERLRCGLARGRMGSALADELRRQLEARVALLTALDSFAHLVHGDFGGRNILVAPQRDGDWRISGLIDWEAASTGSTLWDVGSLFRYGRRYSENFCKDFENGYAEAGGALPWDWRRTARLLDSMRLVEILDGERELPVVFAECLELIEAVISEWA
ncbi:MAG: aminoglycoside phosphotransferase family protein [Pyrinomonadaceae bacterium]|nr:aminoglycoside phosphotransferase family protein [Pyrinomonadaceae bacterium]